MGWTAGVGVEVALRDNWTAKIEYLYASLQSGSCTSIVNCGTTTPVAALTRATPPVAVPANDTVKFSTSLVRVGINYKFGGGQ